MAVIKRLAGYLGLYWKTLIATLRVNPLTKAN